VIMYASKQEPPGGPDDVRFWTWDSKFWSELNSELWVMAVDRIVP
jgi:hypothetical protein